MENILIACSNYPAIKIIQSTQNNNDIITYIILLFTISISFLSHLFENHKHGMSGWYLSRDWSFFLNRLDLLGVIVTLSRFLYLYYIKYGWDLSVLIPHQYPLFLTFSGIVFNIISEYDQQNPELKAIYIIAHIMWHLIFFDVMDYFYITLFVDF